MLVKSLFCLIGLLAVTNAGDTCTYTDNYVYYPELNMSYKFNIRALIWGKAREYCLSENATLATPKNAAERDTLVKIFSQYPLNVLIGPPAWDHIFLGFHDFFVEKEFISEAGFSMDYFYRDFMNGHPNRERDENSVSMDRTGKYHDYPQNRLGVFICQRDHSNYEKKLLAEVHRNEDSAYVTDPGSNKRYKLHTDLKTWGVARSICFAEGGNLAIIRNRQEEMFLKDMLNNPKNDVRFAKNPGYAFVGVHDMFIEGRYVTVEGENLENIGYAHWGNAQPNGGAENCVALYKTGEIHDISCDAPNLYFCEIFSHDTHDTHEENYFNNV